MVETGASGAFKMKELEEIRRRAGRNYLEFLDVPAMRAGLYYLPAGELDPQEPHDEDEMYFVVAGRARFTVDGKTTDVGPGTLLYVRARAPHCFHDIREDLTVLVFFSAAPAGRAQLGYEKAPAAEAGAG